MCQKLLCSRDRSVFRKYLRFVFLLFGENRILFLGLENATKLNKKSKILHLGRNSFRPQYMLGSSSLESYSAEEVVGVLVDKKLNIL